MAWKEKGGRKLRARNGKKIRTDKSRMKEKHREGGRGGERGIRRLTNLNTASTICTFHFVNRVRIVVRIPASPHTNPIMYSANSLPKLTLLRFGLSGHCQPNVALTLFQTLQLAFFLSPPRKYRTHQHAPSVLLGRNLEVESRIS